MYLIDTNIFIEVIRDQENSEESKELLKKISRGEINATLSEFTLHAVEGHTTEKPEVIRKFLKTIDNSLGLEISSTGIQEEKEAAAFSKQSDLDFDDALQHHTAVKEDIERIISFDKDFDSTDLKRMEPGELLE
jgi:predicted nucleic acid-binding protein